MKPIAIFRHIPHEGAGYFGEFLARHGIPMQLVRIDANEPVPADTGAFSGLVFMGGSMSVNDPLPWIPHSLELIRQAVACGIPVLGHCLGGQLMSRALGAAVTRNPVKEIGWGAVSVEDSDLAREWLGNIRSFDSFHWHGETFALPADATRILGSAYCTNQAWVADNRHLAMQCHVEMTEDMIRSWCEHGAQELAEASTSPAVQSAQAMQAGMTEKLAALHGMADRLYERWLGGVTRQ